MPHRFIAVIPAFNEVETIEEVSRRTKRHADVCVVDDGSTDGTGDRARAVDGVHVIRHAVNTHLAGAILDGMRYAIEGRYDFCITLDAGLSHDPDEIPRLKARTDADLVLGRRETRLGVPVYRRALSWGASAVVNLAIARRRVPWGGAGIRDVTSGFRMYSRRAVDTLLGAELMSRAFSFHFEALAILFRAGAEIEEVPISYTFSNSSLQPAAVSEAIRTAARLWASGAVDKDQLRSRRANSAPSQ